MQDEITESVVAALEPHLYAQEDRRLAGQPPGDISTWGLVVRAIVLASHLGQRHNEEARSLLGRAVAKEPTYAKAHAVLSWTLWWAAWNYWLPNESEGAERAKRHAQEALALDPSEPWARMMLGLCLSSEGHHERALRELEDALLINPSFALAHSIYGWALARAGRFDEAVVQTGTALRLSPADSFLSFYEFLHGFALLVSRRYGEALPLLRKSIVAFPEFATHYALLISCCGHMGLREEAQTLLEHRNTLGPRLKVSLNRSQLKKYATGPIIAEGLSKAGVPEN